MKKKENVIKEQGNIIFSMALRGTYVMLKMLREVPDKIKMLKFYSRRRDGTRQSRDGC